MLPHIDLHGLPQGLVIFLVDSSTDWNQALSRQLKELSPCHYTLSTELVDGQEFKFFVLCEYTQRQEVAKALDKIEGIEVTGDGNPSPVTPDLFRVWFLNKELPIKGEGVYRNNVFYVEK